MKEREIRFTAGQSSIALGENIAAEIAGNKVTVKLKYDFNERPLSVSAPCAAGDKVRLVLRPYRIDLYVNDTLFDEEWPCGNEEFTVCENCPDTEVVPAPSDDTRGKPAVIRSGISLADIRKNGVNIGDCMPFSDPDNNSVYHLFFLYDRRHHGSKWSLGGHQWAHLSTTDLVSWDEHPIAVPISAPWEGSICTGSVGKAAGRYYAWYAVRMYDRSPAKISHSCSDDLYHFEKSGEYFILPDRYEQKTARDPKFIEYGGEYHLLITTSLLSSGNGCLAHLKSPNPDMSGFVDCGPVMEWHTPDQPECPDWFEYNGYYYLAFSIQGKMHCLPSRAPFEGFRVTESLTFPAGCVPKAAFFGSRLIFTGFTAGEGWAGSAVLSEATQNEDGTLSYTELK